MLKIVSPNKVKLLQKQVMFLSQSSEVSDHNYVFAYALLWRCCVFVCFIQLHVYNPSLWVADREPETPVYHCALRVITDRGCLTQRCQLYAEETLLYKTLF